MDMGLIRQKWESTDGIASQQMELRKIKGSGDGERNQRGKKEKKRKFGENITFNFTKS